MAGPAARQAEWAAALSTFTAGETAMGEREIFTGNLEAID
jgi:hypothetical protein